MKRFFVFALCAFLLLGCENVVNVFSTSLGSQLTRDYDFSSQSTRELTDKLSSNYTTPEQKRDILVELDKKSSADVSKLSNEKKSDIIIAAVDVACADGLITNLLGKIKLDALDETDVNAVLDALPKAESFVGINTITNIVEAGADFINEENFTSLTMAAGVMVAHTASWLKHNRNAFNDDGEFFSKFRDFVDGADEQAIYEAAGLVNPEPGSVDAQVKKTLDTALKLVKDMKGFEGFDFSALGKLFEG